MNMAGFFARNLMVESEHLLEGKPFGELKDEETGTYPEPYARFKWKREIKEIKFPDFGVFTSSEEEGQNGNQNSNSEVGRQLGQAVTKFLSDGVRELIVTVSWPRGDGEQTVRLTTYLIDLNARFNFSI